MSENKTYLGDGVYCDYVNPFEIRIYVNNGIKDSNEIYFDFEMVKLLSDFVQKNMNPEGEENETVGWK